MLFFCPSCLGRSHGTAWRGLHCGQMGPVHDLGQNVSRYLGAVISQLGRDWFLPLIPYLSCSWCLWPSGPSSSPAQLREVVWGRQALIREVGGLPSLLPGLHSPLGSLLLLEAVRAWTCRLPFEVPGHWGHCLFAPSVCLIFSNIRPRSRFLATPAFVTMACVRVRVSSCAFPPLTCCVSPWFLGICGAGKGSSARFLRKLGVCD